MEREKIRFASGGTECAAWHYPGTNGGCVGAGRAAGRAPHGELVRLPGGHYAPFLDGHEAG